MRSVGRSGKEAVVQVFVANRPLTHFHEPGVVTFVVDLPGDCGIKRQVRRFAGRTCPQVLGRHGFDDRFGLHWLFGSAEDLGCRGEHAQLLLRWRLLESALVVFLAAGLAFALVVFIALVALFLVARLVVAFFVAIVMSPSLS